MMSACRRFFLGANSARGFMSHHRQFTDLPDVKLLILKGGPGVGKSTFMRQISSELQSRGHEAEHYHCSSDPLSIDGVFFERSGVAIVDGTPPHVIDPLYPGVTGEICNLGEFWSSDDLQRKREQIITLISQIGDQFIRAYRCLYVAGTAHDAISRAYSEAIDTIELDRFIKRAASDISSGQTQHKKRAVSAITPRGIAGFIDEIVNATDNVTVLDGAAGSAVPVIARLLAELERGRASCQLMMCGLHPDRVDHIVGTDAAVVNGTQFHQLETKPKAKIIETDRFYRSHVLSEQQGELEAARAAVTDMIKRAVNLLDGAYQMHVQLESIYTSAMDYKSVDRCRNRVLRQLLRQVRRADC